MVRVKYNRAVVLMLFISLATTVASQRVVLRNNLLYDLSLTPNLGMDVRVDSTWSVGLTAGYNAWDINKSKDKKWRHLLVSANARRYLGDSLYHKRYVEGNLIYSHFNVGNTKIPFGLYNAVKNRRLQGDLFALGAKYGYSWILARDWRIDAEAGIAVGYAWFKEYECPTCGQFIGNDCRIFLLPQLGINVVYIIN